ncbi:DUF177 domain-containing protein [Rhodovarius crocodyli]|uniref:DUF177 domain-containing protein n=1 Tax=Rhodovarius crocodyli TaxID=1979269 RepID=A0A437LZA5_9PROT|nr:DUF177 domain-containing protein [Rhodovarius crocodyli]RVT90695.1 DUF177 domain-containing protein [Rhodovarius crocodyli]
MMEEPIEFSRPLRVAGVPRAGHRLALSATAPERAALAARLGLLALHDFSADLALSPDSLGGVEVRGSLSAEVEQACVVTMEPVRQSVREEFAFRIIAEGQEPSESPDAEDEVETVAGHAELGEVLAQLLSLALDPYPRKEGAELPPEASDPEASPFGALLQLRQAKKE